MKKIYHLIAFAMLPLLLSGCYKDKGNYNYSNIGDITVDIASGIYEYQEILGAKLSIAGKVVTDVPESQLSYMWEIVSGARFADLAEGKNFDEYLGPNDNFPTYGTYRIRLKVSRQIDGYSADVYSPLVTITISGETGLMVLHGDNSQSDIGLIQYQDFAMASSVSVTEKISYDLYSLANGSKVAGKGVKLEQGYLQNGAVANANVFVVTDQANEYLSAAGFLKKGDYENLFYSVAGHDPLCRGKLEQFAFFGTNRALIDDGQLFYASGTTNLFNTPIVFTDYGPYRLSKWSYLASPSYLFDEQTRGFFMSSITGSPISYTPYNAVSGAFNPGNMQADLIYFDRIGTYTINTTSGNFLGVFKDDNNEIFLGQINFAASNTDESPYAVGKYGINELAEFESAIFHAVGKNSSMCYYATASDVYHYALLGADITTTATKLMVNTAVADLSGEITMMKVIKPKVLGKAVYQHYGMILLVGTYENGEGKLHAFMLDEFSGSATSQKTFGGFGRITDANLKAI